MKPERRRPSSWRRGLALAGICLLGLVTIIGSGGGGGLDAVCETYPDSCAPPPPAPPSVSVVPPSVTAQVGTVVTFMAVPANFSGAVSYQWRRSSDGGTSFVNIAGATAKNYTLASVNLADDGAVFMALAWQGASAAVQATSTLRVSATPAVVFADGDFPADHWQASPAIVAGYPPFTHVEERVDAGGTPAAFRKMTVQVAPGSSVSSVTHLSITSVYDPRTQGAISSIDYAENCNLLSSSETSYAESAVFFEQSGRRYVSDASPTPCMSATWTALAQYGLQQQDFRLFDGPACAASDCPDFSATAAPVRFGYRRTTFGSPGTTVEQGIDNWRVTVWRR